MDLKTLNKCFLYMIVCLFYLSLAHNAVLGGGAMEISSAAFKDGGKIPIQCVMPAVSIELKNSFGDIGYGGPQPPKGTGDHPYVVTLYSLSVEKLDLGVNTSLSAFKKALEGKVIGSASITGKYGR